MTNKKLLLKAIYEISDKIVKKKEDISSEVNMGLFSGSIGISLFLFHMYGLTKETIYKDTAFYYLEKSLEKINAREIHPSFCNGIAGIAWGVKYLVKHSFISNENLDMLNDLDEYLHKSMIYFAKNGNFDFMHGATGIALYFINRINYNSKAIDFLREYVDLLKNNSIYDSDNDSIKIISSVFDENKQLKKVYNLGMAHGMSSIIVVLSKILEIDKNNFDVKFLIKGFVTYILANENIKKYPNKSIFPSAIDVDRNKSYSALRGSRLGWCYGDLGNAFALYQASRILNNKKYYEKSLEIFMNSTKRKCLKEQTINDTGMCFGSAGLIDIFKTVYEYFKKEKFKELENYWVNVTLDFYKKSNGLEGFSIHTLLCEPKYKYGILDGLAGVGLALLSHITGNKSNWNELLLLK